MGPPGGLRRDAERFLRGFGVLVAVWSTVLALAAPVVERPTVMVAGLAVTWAWALVAAWLAPRRPWAWGSGWLVVAVCLELLGPASGTDGWSLAGGSALLVLAAGAVGQRRAALVGAVVALSLAVLGRGLFVEGHTIGASLGTLFIFAFSAVSLWWLVRTVLAGEAERAGLRSEVARAEAERAFAVQRAESAARLHDSVLQSLASIHRADDLEEAGRHADRASAELRAWIRDRVPTPGPTTLRRALEAVVAADGGGRAALAASGDAPCDDAGGLLVEATREAVRNAVAHAQGAVRVYLEVRDGRATAWVADLGPGFDLDDVPEDRHGVRSSIVGRLERAGGTARLSSGPDGSEWELSVPVGAGGSAS